jgi:hypothetical protein
MKNSQTCIVIGIIGLFLTVVQAFLGFEEFQIGLTSPFRYFLSFIGPFLISIAMFIQWRKNVDNGGRR